jgi:hypothetical protein
MCDYSLHGIRNRLAEEGETLVVHRFCTGSKGLTSPKSLKPTEQPQQKGLIGILRRIFVAKSSECAVCVPDGAKVVLLGISQTLQKTHGLRAMERATFRQMSAEAATYRDSLEFNNGVRVRLQDFEEGQGVEVLALSSEEGSVLPARFVSGSCEVGHASVIRGADGSVESRFRRGHECVE